MILPVKELLAFTNRTSAMSGPPVRAVSSNQWVLPRQCFPFSSLPSAISGKDWAPSFSLFLPNGLIPPNIHGRLFAATSLNITPPNLFATLPKRLHMCRCRGSAFSRRCLSWSLRIVTFQLTFPVDLLSSKDNLPSCRIATPTTGVSEASHKDLPHCPLGISLHSAIQSNPPLRSKIPHRRMRRSIHQLISSLTSSFDRPSSSSAACGPPVTFQPPFRYSWPPPFLSLSFPPIHLSPDLFSGFFPRFLAPCPFRLSLRMPPCPNQHFSPLVRPSSPISPPIALIFCLASTSFNRSLATLFTPLPTFLSLLSSSPSPWPRLVSPPLPLLLSREYLPQKGLSLLGQFPCLSRLLRNPSPREMVVLVWWRPFLPQHLLRLQLPKELLPFWRRPRSQQHRAF